MIHSFVNLVSWRYFIRLDEKKSVKINIDSTSLTVCCWLFGVPVKRYSGISHYHGMQNVESALYLVPMEKGFHRNEIGLPFWADLESISIDDDVLKRCRKNNCIILGISSPKQDLVARIIQKECPNADIYCLGAAVSSLSIDTLFDSMALGWFSLAFRNPVRFYSKMSITISEIFKILFDKRTKEEFKSFLMNVS